MFTFASISGTSGRAPLHAMFFYFYTFHSDGTHVARHVPILLLNKCVQVFILNLLEVDLDSVKETERERGLIGGAQPLSFGLWAPGRTRYINREDAGTRTNVRRAHAAPQSQALPI